MTARERRRLACLALALITAVVLVLAGGAGPADRGTATSARPTMPSAPVVQTLARVRSGPDRRVGLTPGQRAAREDLPTGVAPGRALDPRVKRAEATAAVFVRALLRLESTGAFAGEKALRGHATRRLANRILSRQARLPSARAAPTAGRLVALEPLTIGPDRAEFVATIARNGGRTGLLLTVVRRQGRWLVGDLG